MLQNKNHAVISIRYMKIKSCFIALIVLYTFAVPGYAQNIGSVSQKAIKLGIPSDQVYLVVNKAKVYHISDSATSEMLETLIKAKEDNIPVNKIANKLLEGISKHVEPDLIIKTANRLEYAYRSANEVYNQIEIKGTKTGELRDVIATAIFNGVSPEELISLYKVAPHANETYYIIGTLSLTSLIASGIPKEKGIMFIKKEFEENKDDKSIQHDTMKMMEKPINDREFMMKHGTENNNGVNMNRMNMPENPSERMPVNRDMDMRNPRN